MWKPTAAAQLAAKDAVIERLVAASEKHIDATCAYSCPMTCTQCPDKSGVSVCDEVQELRDVIAAAGKRDEKEIPK